MRKIKCHCGDLIPGLRDYESRTLTRLSYSGIVMRFNEKETVFKGFQCDNRDIFYENIFRRKFLINKCIDVV